uniref:SbsA Ig-like domain-containing protein n=1 Tax=uncultured bacterium contig00010(2014) TaxID=1465626 RepID=A0A060CWH7_9BACT|nr:hypothetical protein [uncultured bacterium contig00010(2014)]
MKLRTILTAATVAVLAACEPTANEGGLIPGGAEEGGEGGSGAVPKVETSSISNGAMEVVPDAGDITITWNVPIEVANRTAITMGGNYTVIAQNRQLTISHLGLAGLTPYTLTIGAGAIKAKSGGKKTKSGLSRSPPQKPFCQIQTCCMLRSSSSTLCPACQMQMWRQRPCTAG